MIAGVSLVFSITVASYVTPSLLIGDRYMTMSQVMAKAYLNIRDFQLGASMAVIMLVIATVIVVSASFLARAPERGALTMARLGMGFCWTMLDSGAGVSVRAHRHRRRRVVLALDDLLVSAGRLFLALVRGNPKGGLAALLGMALGTDRIPCDLHLAHARHAVRHRDRARARARPAKRLRPSWPHR